MGVLLNEGGFVKCDDFCLWPGDQPYRSERPHHHYEDPPIREAARGERSYERDHWRSEPHQPRRNVPPLSSTPPRSRQRIADAAYERPYLDDIRRSFRGGIARGGGARSLRSGRGAMRPPPHRSVPLHRPSRHWISLPIEIYVCF